MAADPEKTSAVEAALHPGANATGSTDNRIVRLEELAAADRALAEQYGYQPVCLAPVLCRWW